MLLKNVMRWNKCGHLILHSILHRNIRFAFQVQRCQYSKEEVDYYEVSKTITNHHVKIFTDLTEDSNPIHSDQNKESKEGTPIVPGALLMSLVAGIMGSHFPGPGAKVISQEMNFMKPCPVGTNVNIRVELAVVNGVVPQQRKLTNYNFVCKDTNDNSLYMKGNAKLRIKL